MKKFKSKAKIGDTIVGHRVRKQGLIRKHYEQFQGRIVTILNNVYTVIDNECNAHSLKRVDFKLLTRGDVKLINI